MQRLLQTSRPGWPAQVEALGLSFHSIGGIPYWDEGVAYRFSAREIETLETAANELQDLALAAAESIIKRGDYARFGIPEAAIPLIEASWEADEAAFYGRFDFHFDGVTPPKLLEYNADTPTSLLEAAVVQWDWLEAVHPGCDQFNWIHEALIEAWGSLALPAGPLAFSSVNDSEDQATLFYLMETATQAGLSPQFLSISKVGWDGQNFVDLADRPLACLFKLYPWEWLVTEPFATHIAQGKTRWIEPAWKLLLTGKGLLVALWELAPGHPNLLSAAFTPESVPGPRVRKPLWGREGANVRLERPGEADLALAGPFEHQPMVWQTRSSLPCFDGNYPVLGVWMVDSEACGLGIREDVMPITGNSSRFVPHFIDG